MLATYKSANTWGAISFTIFRISSATALNSGSARLDVRSLMIWRISRKFQVQII
jgi:hypothetical protein